MPDSDQEISFTLSEQDALVRIIKDWINEELVVPPYDFATTAVMEKLGVGVDFRASSMSPKTQERLSNPGGKYR